MSSPRLTKVFPLAIATASVLLLGATSGKDPADTAKVGKSATAPTTECGNGILEAGESCDTCAEDCKIRDCEPTDTKYRVEFSAGWPASTFPDAATIMVAYRSDKLHLAGEDQDESVKAALTTKEKPYDIQAIRDFEYGARLVLAESERLPADGLFSLEFQGCKGAGAPTADDLRCIMEGCAGNGVDIANCTCSAKLP